jgi:hypothetical protein
MFRVQRLIIQLAVALLWVLFPKGAIAADPPQGTTTFGGLNWGIGIATDFNLTGQRIVSATVVQPNNIVRVTDASDSPEAC